MGHNSSSSGCKEEKKMICTPKTYSEWIQMLDNLKKKQYDNDILTAMKNGSLEWQSGVAERFSKRLLETVNSRLNTALDEFQRDINYARGSEGATVQALIKLRKELCFLTDIVDLPALPEKYRDEYKKIIIEQSDKVQKSLEDSAKKDRTGKMLSIINNHKVNIFSNGGIHV